MRLRGLEAVDALLAESPPPRLGAFVCDANIPTVAALHALVRARPIMAPGASVVVTLKNFDGNRAWKARCDEAEAALTGMCTPGSVRRIWLFGNGLYETTLVGVMACVVRARASERAAVARA